MRVQDIKVGFVYRHKDHPRIGYAKVLDIIKPKPKYLQKTEIEKQIKSTVVKCGWSMVDSFDFCFIKYFKPSDLVK